MLGYLSHILADMLTPPVCRCCGPVAGASGCRSFAPRKGNQLERALCMALFVYAVWMPQTLADNSAIRWSSGVINSLQITFNRFISHQSGR
ncbi:membrane protein [Klebsiella pneumoniae]|uniref:Membrane protein n=1 Tax=Klebsiella pneumoniae TaxID=573 RepID=A0A377W589_KLEPN|nr:membrane protein [Klebsiella pneumoniae]